MVNWKDRGILFKDFTSKKTQEWISKGFGEESCKEWLEIGMNPNDSDFCVWLRNVKNLTPEQAKNSNTQLLREQHAKYLTSKANSLEVLSTSFEFSFSLNTKNIKQEEICKELEKLSLNNESSTWLKEASKHLTSENWKNLHPDFTEDLKREWESKGFSYEQVKEWVSSLKDCFEVDDYDLCAWLRDEKELTPTTLNYDELDDLIDEYSASSSQEEASEEEVSKNYSNAQEWLDKKYSNKKRQ